jgi:hypothetical protein
MFAPTRLDMGMVQWQPRLMDDFYAEQGYIKSAIEMRRRPKNAKTARIFCPSNRVFDSAKASL